MPAHEVPTMFMLAILGAVLALISIALYLVYRESECDFPPQQATRQHHGRRSGRERQGIRNKAHVNQ